MVFEIISKIAGGLMVIVTVIRLMEGSRLADFVYWLGLGRIVEFVIQFYPIIAAILVVGVVFKSVRDWKWLLAIGFTVWLIALFIL